jgi:hypothetical protein
MQDAPRKERTMNLLHHTSSSLRWLWPAHLVAVVDLDARAAGASSVRQGHVSRNKTVVRGCVGCLSISNDSEGAEQ